MNIVRIRIIISLFVFILFLFLYCGSERISSFLASTLLLFQFIPALIKSFTNPTTIVIVGLISIIMITMIFGRVYCSFLCPLGTLQDIFIALSKKINSHKKYSFQKPYNLLRYTWLLFIIITGLLGSISLLIFFDPYSIIGRMITQFALPFFLWTYNLAVSVLRHFHIYFFYKETASLTISFLLLNVAFLILIMSLALKHGRLYCNTICPVGMLLGLISRVSLFKFTIDKTQCRECMQCSAVCTAGCIDAQNAVIDQSRCINCFNCLQACPQSFVNYRLSLKNNAGVSWSPARRIFLIGSLTTAGSALLVSGSFIRNLLPSPQASNFLPIIPPGSVSIEHLRKSCSACHLCVSACPTKVITPSLLECGISGLLQPKMNYPESFCEYECNLCGQICPTGSILPLSREEKILTQIGKVDLLKDKCIVYVDNKNCGACVEVCPTKAITFIDRSNILYPEVDNRYCIGCGACSKACPTAPKSIVVRTNPVHKKAHKYVRSAAVQQPPNATSQDFPF